VSAGRDPLAIYRKAQRRWMAEKGFRCPYMAVVIASLEGKGVRLSASDCDYLSQDSALSTIASNHLLEFIDEDD
jgi:hypothetical protein